MPEVSVPPPPVAEGEDPADAMVSEQRELEIGHDTPTPDWDGHRMDVDWALYVLSPPLLSTPDAENVSEETPAVETPAEETEARETSAPETEAGQTDATPTEATQARETAAEED